MRFKNLHLENFRCFQNMDIDFNTNEKNDGGLTVLVAQNAEGKTTILDAVNIVIGPFLKKLTGIADRYTISYEDNHRLQDGSISGYARIDATLLNPKNFVQKWGCEDFHVIRFFDGLSNYTKTEDHYHLTNLAKFIFNWQNDGAPWPLVAYYGDQRLWESLSGKEKFDPMLTQNRLAGYLDARKPAISYKRCLKWMNELSLALFGEQKKKEDGDTSFSQETIDKLQCFMNLMKDALRTALAPSGYTEINFNVSKNEIEVWGENHPVRIEASRLSAGIRIVIGMISDMVYRSCLLNPQLKGQILQNTPGIVLIDEVELHLHPAWQQQIVPALQCIFPNVQFIITTHSPQVVSSVPKECVRIINEGKIVPFDTQTQGVESQDILAQIFGIDPAPQQDPFVQMLNKYAKMEAAGKADSEEALSLREQLIQHFGEQYPPFQRIEIHRNFFAGKKGGKNA